MANSESYTERVRPDNGQQESGWVFLTIALILLLGGFGITQNQTASVVLPEHLSLSVTDKALLTALRNAGDEIQFMREPGAALPTVSQLQTDAVPPFVTTPGQRSNYRWQLLEKGCYLGTPTLTDPVPEAAVESGMQFLLTFADGVNVYWQSADDLHNDQPSLSCTPDNHWQVFKNA